MFKNTKHFAAAIVALTIGLGAGSVAVGAAMDNLAQTGDDLSIGLIIDDAIDFSTGPVQCEIVSSTNNGVMTLESVVHAQIPISGSYVLMVASVNGQNRSRIQQGGSFAADMDHSATLNKMMLGNRGATYDVSLKLTVNGQFLECAEQIAA